jgi:HD-like signal output (HDOD) protein
MVRLNEVARDPDSSASELAEVILHDPSLSSRILRIANSAFYSRAGTTGITTVTQAVVVIGFQPLVRLALGLSVLNMFDIPARDPVLLNLWIQSMACAVAARHLAKAARAENLEEAFVAGLIHNLGSFIYLRADPAQYGHILERSERGENHLDVEREELGFTLAELGSTVARRWKLPRVYVDSIGAHQEFSMAGSPIQNVVALAHRIAAVHCAIHHTDEDLEIGDFGEMAQRYLKIDPAVLGDLSDSLRSEVTHCLEIFGLRA